MRSRPHVGFLLAAVAIGCKKDDPNALPPGAEAYDCKLMRSPDNCLRRALVEASSCLGGAFDKKGPGFLKGKLLADRKTCIVEPYGITLVFEKLVRNPAPKGPPSADFDVVMRKGDKQCARLTGTFVNATDDKVKVSQLEEQFTLITPGATIAFSDGTGRKTTLGCGGKSFVRVASSGASCGDAEVNWANAGSVLGDDGRPKFLSVNVPGFGETTLEINCGDPTIGGGGIAPDPK